MPVVIAAVVLVGTLCVLNLLLTFGVLRRLREYSAALAISQEAALPELLQFVGRPLPAFTSQSPQLLGFFKAGCPSCVVQARQFAKVAAGERTGVQMDALAVVVGSGPDAEALHELLRDVQTVVDPESSELVNELDVQLMPSFLRLDSDGVVLNAEVTIEAVLEPSKV